MHANTRRLAATARVVLGLRRYRSCYAAILLVMLVGAAKAQTPPGSYNNYYVCSMAVDSPRSSWDYACDSCRAYISEAGRRGISLDRCLAILRGSVADYSAARPATASQPVIDPAVQALVAEVQRLLGQLGFSPGPADGAAGPQTVAAVREFQRARQLPETGQVNAQLREQLRAAASERGRSDPADSAARPSATGTAFYLSSAGMLVTNRHIVAGCRSLRLWKRGLDIGSARPFALNEPDDLAILQTEEAPRGWLKLRVGDPLKVAEPILVFGYPLSAALSTLGNTTLGNVTALAGIGDDYSLFQMSAPIQPGNSGGPVLDMQGRLVGVARGKLNALMMVRATGDIPQNVNFAIKTSTLISFLEAQGVAFETASAAPPLETTRVAEIAAEASVEVRCLK